MRVQIEFQGEPFDCAAVLHTLRHLALRAGWTICAEQAERRIVYATTDNPATVQACPGDLVILSSPVVKQHLTKSVEPIPLVGNLPFVHPSHEGACDNWLTADVIAGASAVMNLWYETRTRARATDGWMLAREDWWSKAGLARAEAYADQWLDEILRAAERLGWGRIKRPRLLDAPFVVVLTHDVDYLPGAHDYGLPRFLRTLARQVMVRRNVRDAFALTRDYAGRWRTNPYWTLESVMAQERQRNAYSSFQFVSAHGHAVDPAYNIADDEIATALRGMGESEWEVCMHGSYSASRTNGQLAREKEVLEHVAGIETLGHRQHYLNFHPPQLWTEVERAGFAYDMSVGYNDAMGARAGTLFPYRPFDLEGSRAYSFWEIPFVVMDTTLATTFKDSPKEALRHAQAALEPVCTAGGCVGIIWHAEQSSGVLDPGYDQVYVELLDWIQAQGGKMVSGRALLNELDTRWRATWSDA